MNFLATGLVPLCEGDDTNVLSKLGCSESERVAASDAGTRRHRGDLGQAERGCHPGHRVAWSVVYSFIWGLNRLSRPCPRVHLFLVDSLALGCVRGAEVI